MKRQTKRKDGRALFYLRDSGGRHEQTPGQYVAWALRETLQLKLSFMGSPNDIDEMIRKIAGKFPIQIIIQSSTGGSNPEPTS